MTENTFCILHDIQNVLKMEGLKSGSVVICNSHEHPMCIKTIKENLAICDYFIEGELYTEEHDIEKLFIINH